jgi:hypothetical protein
MEKHTYFPEGVCGKVNFFVPILIYIGLLNLAAHSFLKEKIYYFIGTQNTMKRNSSKYIWSLHLLLGKSVYIITIVV